MSFNNSSNSVPHERSYLLNSNSSTSNSAISTSFDNISNHHHLLHSSGNNIAISLSNSGSNINNNNNNPTTLISSPIILSHKMDSINNINNNSNSNSNNSGNGNSISNNSGNGNSISNNSNIQFNTYNTFSENGAGGVTSPYGLSNSSNPLMVGVGYENNDEEQIHEDDYDGDENNAILTAGSLSSSSNNILSKRNKKLEKQQLLMTPPADLDHHNNHHHHISGSPKPRVTLNQLQQQNKKQQNGNNSLNNSSNNNNHINNNNNNNNKNGLSVSSQIFTSVPLNSPNVLHNSIGGGGGGGQHHYQNGANHNNNNNNISPQSPLYIHRQHSSQINEQYLSILGASQNVVIKKKRAAIDLKLGRKWLTNIIVVQMVGNLIRALPIFILEKYYVMLLIFFQGSYGVKKLKKYLILLYAMGCFSTTILDLVITFTYAHSLSERPFKEIQFAFWSYVLFVTLLCTLNIVGGILFGLKIFVSLHTLDDRTSSPLVLLAASLVGSFDSHEDDENASNAAKMNRTILFYGSDLKKALNVTMSLQWNLAVFDVLREWGQWIKQKFTKYENRPTSSIPADYQVNVQRYASNEVITSKYNVVTFLPKSMCYRPPDYIGGKGTFVELAWRDIKVGDIIMVKGEELLPADIVCLSTSRPDGRTYLETANLDGETNLKLKTNISKTSWIRSAEDLDKFSCRVDYEGPNNDIYGFEGVLTVLKGMENSSNLGQSTLVGQNNFCPITIESLLLRGTKLRNTEWVIGIVTYTGVDTKVEKNSTKSSQKRSSVERGVNNKLIILFLMQTIICIICSIGHNQWNIETQESFESLWYLDVQPGEKDFIYVSYIILYNTLIPLSMYVSMEVIRISNAHFIDSDLEMYDEKTDTPAQARNTNINEELGQIQYLFSDKTGTLTCNEMVFNRCTIGGTVYGPDEDIHLQLNNDLANEDVRSSYVREFLTCLAVCNTVVIEKSKEGADLNYDPKCYPKYQAASPDEEALTIAAAKFGFVLKSREDNVITIAVDGHEERYELLNVLEFNSYRKRMSVIVRTESGQIKLYSKGADSVIMERSEKSTAIPGVDVHKATETHISQFASNGLRTLCMSVVVLDAEAYLTWNRKFEEASVSLVKRAEMMDQAADLIEKNMTLLGATGIEDRLQDYVPETVQSLREAGVKIWVLTGDKQETAISIATASSVIHNGMEIVILNENTKEDLLKRLLSLVSQKRIVSFNDSRRWGPQLFGKLASTLKLDPSDAPLILNRTGEMQVQMAIVIDGSTLQLALDKDLRYHFLQVAKTAESVVCCRCSPSQKAKVVKLVAERSFLFGDGAITMAIGDGANDVPMIQKAHVGVGISGREGMQAVLASDFAIANFHMLRRLLLVHGNRSYKRMTKLILYSFSKNVALSISQFWFGFYSAFSGQMIYFDFLFTLYNALFTSLPVLSLGTFDQDIREESLLSEPTNYRVCQSNKPFSMWSFIYWIFLGMWQSAIIFFVTFFVLQDATVQGGKTLGLWSCGTAAYLYLILTTNIQISSITCYWTKQSFIAVGVSIVASVLFVILYSLVYWIEPEAQDIIFELFTVPDFWFLYIIVPCISMLPFALVTVNNWMFSKNSERYYSEKDGFIKLDAEKNSKK
ncbi:P-type ATPase [Heterostelium album PN500]|uniref:Phospholipid-transporting ATPase n=1 Tax=Heterostelium pallidum (strain ATCC 26659 / Pp 5 / PN500) TaxID=670386 RepID=D3B1D8_HETP5|nr:P-type ATPase [Heterostelium album PN500]EFA85112.1 P-type ATPase [Heterostelium album PN500]|eukprot:XP_020437221.1 P-type ATPase [Heterostelium album PN500]